MKWRLSVAFIASLVLISTALWFRLSPSAKSPSTLVAVSNGEPVNYEEFFTKNLYQATSTNAVPITPTDLLARNLFSSYTELKANGRTSSADLDNLAIQYAQEITSKTPIMPAGRAEISDILTVADTSDNLYQYGQEMTSVRDKYARNAETKYDKQDIDGFMAKIAELYKSSAEEILKIRVPASLAENHLAIINTYFKSSAALKAISNSATDPVSAFAAINLQNSNSRKENELFLNIRLAMMSNGLTP